MRPFNCLGTNSAHALSKSLKVSKGFMLAIASLRAPKLPCEVCNLCRSERGYLCRRGTVIGFDQPGCFSEVALLPEISLVRVDDRISDSEAACLQSLSDSIAAVETANIHIGD